MSTRLVNAVNQTLSAWSQATGIVEGRRSGEGAGTGNVVGGRSEFDGTTSRLTSIWQGKRLWVRVVRFAVRRQLKSQMQVQAQVAWEVEGASAGVGSAWETTVPWYPASQPVWWPSSFLTSRLALHYMAKHTGNAGQGKARAGQGRQDDEPSSALG